MPSHRHPIHAYGRPTSRPRFGGDCGKCDSVGRRRSNRVANSGEVYHLLGTGQPERQLGVPVLPLPAENDRIGFSVTWSPRAELRAEKGSQFSYAVDSTDPVLHVTWRQELPGVQPYLPQISGLIRAWAMVAGLQVGCKPS